MKLKSFEAITAALESAGVQLRRWAALPLERIISALEEMDELAEQFASGPSLRAGDGGG